jgi:large subunit ribosomal protein L21
MSDQQENQNDSKESKESKKAGAKASAKSGAKKAKRSVQVIKGRPTAAADLKFPYAVIATGGKQYRVAAGDMILVEKLDAQVGSDWTAEEVLLVAKGPGQIQLGTPMVKGAAVKFEVLQQTLSSKILIRHHRRRQNSQKTLGHRQPQTRLLVKEVRA